MKPCDSPFFHGAADFGHGAGADEGWLAGFADLGLGHADLAEGRVDVERVGVDAVADTARIVIEQVGGDDLEVVVGGVGEGSLAVAVRPWPRCLRHWCGAGRSTWM